MGKYAYGIHRFFQFFGIEDGINIIVALLIVLVISAIIGAIITALIYFIVWDGGSNMTKEEKDEKLPATFGLSTSAVFVLFFLATCI